MNKKTKNIIRLFVVSQIKTVNTERQVKSVVRGMKKKYHMIPRPLRFKYKKYLVQETAKKI